MTNPPVAHPPETLEGWYALHQVFRAGKGKTGAPNLSSLAKRARASLRPSRGTGGGKTTPPAGWSCFARLIGSGSDLMAIHFRDSLDELARVQDSFAASAVAKQLELSYSFLSVTEAGLYHITAELARAASARGGEVGDAEYVKALADRAAAERESAHIRRRLYPELPANMPYVCFYPMSKRRDEGQNWYTLSLDERSRLMYAHGLTGRRYAGKVQQVISGAIGLDAWEWGVTLFARDPLDFKKLVTDMRFDEVSAKYAVFGDFYVGRLIEP
ncbi:MAG TPA: chlorite dismutase family protein [Gemmatimonadaceae bacterium]|nr:chlorite dismutase family protein [Gemmatimonadaceae bacterium]